MSNPHSALSTEHSGHTAVDLRHATHQVMKFFHTPGSPDSDHIYLGEVEERQLSPPYMWNRLSVSLIHLSGSLALALSISPSLALTLLCTTNATGKVRIQAVKPPSYQVPECWT